MPTLDIHFLDVGQGDGTFIVFPDDRTTMLVDLGSKKNASIAGSDAITFIKNELTRIGSTEIDYLFVTHGDGDHFNLLPKLVTAAPGLTFGEIYTGGKDSDYPKKLRDDIFTLGTWRSFTSGAHDADNKPGWTIQGVKVYLLGVNNPAASGRTAKNSSSIVLMLEYGGGKVILTGDAEDNVENVILNNFSTDFLSSHILKLGHHGSKNATKAPWITAVGPLAIFASADRKWSHPYCEVINRFKTDPTEEALDGNTSLAQLFEHQMVCGTTASEDYKISTLRSAVFTNIILITTDKKSLTYGWVWGTQYRLQVDNNGRMAVNSFDKSSIWID